MKRVAGIEDNIRARLPWALGAKFRKACIEDGVSVTDGIHAALRDWLSARDKLRHARPEDDAPSIGAIGG